MKKRVAIDLSPLYSDHQYRGIGFYTKRLVEALQRSKQTEIELEFVKSVKKLCFIQADLIHYPYFTPFFLSLPAKPLAPSLVTIHDLIPIKYPTHFPSGIKGGLRWQKQKHRLKKMKAIITDSQVWRQEINELTGFSQEKIFSIPLAAGDEFKVIEDRSRLTKIKKKYQLPDTFLLYVGDVNWHKNLVGLIKAVKQLKGLDLICVGKAFLNKDLKEVQELKSLIGELNLNDKIKFLGFIPTDDLVGIYNLAAVCCLVSFNEGFGLPVLEAMACGCSVVAAKAGSLPEICGSSAVMVDPTNVGDIAEGVRKAIKNKNDLVKKGLKNAQEFNWQKTAQETVKVYQKILNEI